MYTQTETKQTTSGIYLQLEEHQASLRQYLERMAKQAEGTKQALSEEHILQLLEAHYQRLQEQLKQMKPTTQEAVEEESRSFIRSLVRYFVTLLEKANRAVSWTAAECEAMQQRWRARILEGDQQLKHSLSNLNEKAADKVVISEVVEKEMLEAMIDTEELTAPEESGQQEGQPLDPSKQENTEQTNAPSEAGTEVFGEAPPEDPYEQILTEVFLPEQTAPENVASLVQAVQENTRETLHEVQEVITQKATEEALVLTLEKLTEILQEREANLLQTVQDMLDKASKAPMEETLQQEKTATVTKIKAAYQAMKQVVKVHAVDQVIQTKNQVALTLRKGVLHVNQKLYQLSIQLEEKLQENIAALEIERPSLLEAYPDMMQEAGFSLTVDEETYLIRYTEEENQLMITSENNPKQTIAYTEKLTMERLEETLRQSTTKMEAFLPEDASEEKNKIMDF
ncbi:hypothetical protein HB837_14495 [Listeria innocua]|uniref:hypothetical protein n=1 Tax=Listeria innocua TaxID=1642 RepID=UPI001629E2C6|nr:hypothetical protein [Listeria innocua]MBC1339405.1 hypothetical protein [Listeria innocua]MBC1353645.1 hypothetical protein [Listeria innocua]